MKGSKKMPTMIILAGGLSKRMGVPKGLVSYLGEPLILGHIKSYQTIGGDDIVLVSSVYYEKYQALIEEKNVRHYKNATPTLGPFFSLQLALTHCQSEERDLLVCPVDSAPMSAEVYNALSEARSKGATACIPTYKERGGHPVWLGHELIGEIRSQDPAQSRLDYYLKELDAWAWRVPVNDQNVLKNFNTPDQLP